jgi:hypothetical protein
MDTMASEASEDHRLIISQRMQATLGGMQTGTWVAAGAINDAGTANATTVVVPHGGGKALVTATHVLTSPAGMLQLKSHTWLRPFPPPTPNRVMVEGTWQLVAATGAYANLHAHGKLYATVSPGVVDPGPKEITIVRDGSAQ